MGLLEFWMLETLKFKHYCSHHTPPKKKCEKVNFQQKTQFFARFFVHSKAPMTVYAPKRDDIT